MKSNQMNDCIVKCILFSFLFLCAIFAKAQDKNIPPHLQLLLQKCKFENKETVSILRNKFVELSKKNLSPSELVKSFHEVVKLQLTHSTEYLECTITTQNTLSQYRYRNGQENSRSKLLVFATKGAGDAFWTLEEVADFWKDTLVVIDTLTMDLSKLSGIKNGEIIYSINDKKCAFNKNNSTGQLYLSAESPGIAAGQFQKVSISTDAINSFNYSANVYFLSEEDKQELKDYLEGMISENPTLKNGVITSLAISYMQLNIGPPVEQNVIRFLRNEKMRK